MQGQGQGQVNEVLLPHAGAGVDVLAWTFCHCGHVVHAGCHRVVMVALSMLLLGHPAGCGGGCIVDACLHQVVVVARCQWWVVQGVMVVRSVVGMVVVEGHAAVMVVVGSSTLLI